VLPLSTATCYSRPGIGHIPVATSRPIRCALPGTAPGTAPSSANTPRSPMNLAVDLSSGARPVLDGLRVAEQARRDREQVEQPAHDADGRRRLTHHRCATPRMSAVIRVKYMIIRNGCGQLPGDPQLESVGPGRSRDPARGGRTRPPRTSSMPRPAACSACPQKRRARDRRVSVPGLSLCLRPGNREHSSEALRNEPIAVDGTSPAAYVAVLICWSTTSAAVRAPRSPDSWIDLNLFAAVCPRSVPGNRPDRRWPATLPRPRSRRSARG
jgi:hypothetical protein